MILWTRITIISSGTCTWLRGSKAERRLIIQSLDLLTESLCHNHESWAWNCFLNRKLFVWNTTLLEFNINCFATLGMIFNLTKHFLDLKIFWLQFWCCYWEAWNQYCYCCWVQLLLTLLPPPLRLQRLRCWQSRGSDWDCWCPWWSCCWRWWGRVWTRWCWWWWYVRVTGLNGILTSMLHLPLLLSIANNYGVVVILVRYGAVL